MEVSDLLLVLDDSQNAIVVSPRFIGSVKVSQLSATAHGQLSWTFSLERSL